MLITCKKLSSFDAPMSKTATLNVERYSATYGEKPAAEQLFEAQEAEANTTKSFDVFLSHSYADVWLNKSRILQIKQWLESKHGLRVYIDWINDPLLSRNSVTAGTAAVLRLRMQQSNCLFFATSEKSRSSRWMPWELGSKDAHINQFSQDGRCAILPVSEESTQSYQGAEYLGMHPFTEEIASELVLSKQPKTLSAKPVKYKPWATLGANPS